MNATASADVEEELTLLRDEIYMDPSQLSAALMQRDNPRVPPDRHSCPSGDASGESHASTVASKASPSSANARRAPHGRHHAIPGLLVSKTAPTTTPPLTDHPRDARMNHSFPIWATDVPGDTQPDSQIYNNFTSLRRSNTGQISHNVVFGGDEHRTSPGVIEPGDQWTDEHLDDGPTSPTTYNGDQDNPLSPEIQLRMQQNSTGFAFPETPAMAGSKRNNRGEILSSVTRTPGTTMTAAFFANGLAAGGATMSLTQVWNATQVATSPLPDVAQSDPVFQRPSPNFNARKSSPPALTSSPTRLYRSDPSRATTEPRDTYRPMKESQELRERQRLAELELRQMMAKEKEEEDWMEDPQAHDQGLRKSYVAQSVSMKETWTGGKGKPLVISSDAAYITPIRPNHRKVMQISRQIPEEDESDEGSNDELSNLPQTSHKMKEGVVMQVPMTSSRPDKASSGNLARSSPPDSPIPLGRSRLSQAISAPQSQRLSTSQPRIPSGTQTVAIADSQPDIGQPESLPPPPRLADPSSLDSNPRILQSQFTNRSRRATQLTGLDTSSVPRPPRDSSPLVHEDDEQVPSSPPVDFEEQDHATVEEHEHADLVTSDDDLQLVGDKVNHEMENDTDGITGHDENLSSANHLAKASTSQNPSTARSTRERVQSTIPDSEAGIGSDSVLERTEPVITEDRLHLPDQNMTKDSSAEHETSSTVDYQTAPSRHSASPQKRISTQASKTSSSSPRNARLRTLTEIAADPESQKSQDSIDMDFRIDGLDDFDDLVKPVELLQPRPKKRKITYSNKNLRSPAKNSARGFEIPVPEKGSREVKIGPTPAPLEEQKGEVSSGNNVARLLTEPSPGPRERAVAPKSPEIRQAHPDSTPEHAKIGPFETPPSIRRREGAGALAATAAREAVRFNKPAAPTKGKLVRPSKKVRAFDKGAQRLVSNMSKANVASGRSEVPETPEANLALKQRVEPTSELRIWDVQDSIEQMEVDDPQDDAEDAEVDNPIDRGVQPVEESTETLLTPNRVFALFRGRDSKYYPATCLGPTDGTRWKIRFDDGQDPTLVSENFRSLDLRIGDQLKVDLDEMRKHTYVVVGFKDRVCNNEEEWPLTDSRGHRTVVLGIKTREGDSKSRSNTLKTVDVPIASIYITQSMWKNFKDRHYEHAGQSTLLRGSRFQTPSIASNPETPLSRSRRDIANALNASLHYRGSSIASTSSSGIFANMAFAVSFANDDGEREAISAHILDKGGHILEDGFEELFQASDGALEMTTEARSLGFVALISDTHSRRTKYFQALALNLPCLAARWIRDCVTLSTVVTFSRYLLPAGASSFLGGAVRSRIMPIFDPAGPEGSFMQMVDRREKLFQGAMVVLVSGKSKKGEERAKTYAFLSRALGAENVTVVKDVDAAKAALGGEKDANADEAHLGAVYDWVIVDGEKSGKAGSLLFNRTDKRKRDRDDSEEQVVVGTGEVGRRKVKVAGDEFVVQSLILGALCEG